MGTIDQIYALNYIINRQVGKKGGGLTAVFVDLKAAFDSVDRNVLIRAMRERGVREGLVRKVEEMLRETKSRVRVGQVGEELWTARGVRQGCPLSPILFNIMMADMEEEMAKGGWGGVKLGEGKIYTLAYADDVVLLSEEEQKMRSLLRRMEGYLDRKGFELNTEKTKVMRFRKGGGRKKRIE
jgi:retron-type reverse transcriptase